MSKPLKVKLDTKTPFTGKSMVGERSGMLTVVKFAGVDRRNNTAYWKCKCECGKTCVAQGSQIRYGSRRSCGCEKRKRWNNNF